MSEYLKYLNNVVFREKRSNPLFNGVPENCKICGLEIIPLTEHQKHKLRLKRIKRESSIEMYNTYKKFVRNENNRFN